MSADARAAAEAAARASYGRLVASIARRTRDIAAAEDALADAFAAALAQWPVTGIPDRPEAWLLTVARRAHGRAARRAGSAARESATLTLLAEEAAGQGASPFADKRLELLFVCAHPAIDPALHTPLMLQAVLGLDATRIAAAFLVAPATIGQRLVRAKTKIRDSGIGFAVPDHDAVPARLAAVMDAIYIAFGTGWDDLTGSRRRGLTGEAMFLARLLVALVPDAPEPRGLLALLLYCEARAAARRDSTGRFVPLAGQDPARWSRPAITEAETHLRAAAAHRCYGRFQTEAAIQSLHIEARLTGAVPPGALIALYDLLAANDPAIGVLVARAAAYGDRCPADGLTLLDALPSAIVAAYQPYWATRAHLEARDGRPAAASYARAVGLSDDPSVRSFLAARAAAAAYS